jgi:hypothetical protein
VSEAVHQRLRAAAAALSGERVALQTLAAAHGPAALGSLMVLLAAGCAVPMAGAGTVLGFGLLMLVPALIRRPGCVGLSDRLARVRLPLSVAHRLLSLLAYVYGLAARVARPRLEYLVDTPRQPWIAVQVGLMAVLIIVPIPLGNLLPSLALMVLGVGLVFRDGLVVLASALASLLALAWTAALGLGVWHWLVA